MPQNSHEAATLLKAYNQEVSNAYSNKPADFKFETEEAFCKAFSPLNFNHEAAYDILKNSFDYQQIVITYKRLSQRVFKNRQAVFKVAQLFG